MDTDDHDDGRSRVLALGATILLMVLMFTLMFGFGAGFWTTVWVSALLTLAAVIGFIVWDSAPTPTERRQRDQLSGLLFPEGADVAMNDGPGTFAYDVVGESHYVENLEEIVREANLSPAEPGELSCQAFLLCQPSNPHDPNAVAVVIDRKVVGYVPRDEAKDLAPELRRLANTRTKDGRGGQVLCVQARIGWSGPDRIGVRLDLDAG